MKNTPTTPVDAGKEDGDKEQQALSPLVDKAFRDALLYSDKMAQTLKDNIDALASDFNSAQQKVGALLSRLTTLEYQAAETEVDLHNTRSGLRNITGGRGMAVSQGLDGISISYDRSIKWEFTISGDTSMNIGVGTVVRNDTPVTSAATDLTGFSSEGTYYILATLSRAVGTAYNPRIIPDTVTITKSAVNTWPSVDTAGTLIYVLGEVVVNSSSVISDFTQYISDDIHDWQDVPDGQRHVATAPSTRTLNRNPTDNVHKMELELYGAEVATLAGGQTWVNKHALPVLIKDVNLSGDLEWYGIDSENHATKKSLEVVSSLLQIYKMHVAAEAAQTGMDACVRTDTSGEVFWVDWDTLITKVDVTVITDVGFNATTGWIQVKTKTLTVFAAGAESAWTNKIQAFPCETDTVSGQMTVNGVTTDVLVTGRTVTP